MIALQITLFYSNETMTIVKFKLLGIYTHTNMTYVNPKLILSIKKLFSLFHEIMSHYDQVQIKVTITG